MRSLLPLILFFSPSSLYAIEGEFAGAKKPLMIEPVIDPISAGSIFQLIFVLLLIVGLILFAAWIFRRLGQFGGNGNRAIRYLDGISVGQRERIILIEVGETQLLIGVAPGRVEKIHKLDSPIQFDTTAGKTPFARKLAELINRQEGAS